jgi:hypothetical protein
MNFVIRLDHIIIKHIMELTLIMLSFIIKAYVKA